MVDGIGSVSCGISHLAKREKVSLWCYPRVGPVAGPGIGSETLPEPRARRGRKSTATGVDEVYSVSYLPATFTTLFSLAAGLLLGL